MFPIHFTSQAVNKSYLSHLTNPDSPDVFGLIAKYWWTEFVDQYTKDPIACIDQLDCAMASARLDFNESAEKYATDLGYEVGTREHYVRVSQALKSRTGKMFERFIGLAIAHILLEKGSRFAVAGFGSQSAAWAPHAAPSAYEISTGIGAVGYKTAVDADLIIFNPMDEDDDTFLVSIKSSLKDRFHNVAFWNVARLAALSNDTSWGRLGCSNPDALRKAKYVAICSDLSDEQPDFANPKGPRNLLCFDAALLDGAYVTSSKARGLVKSTNHLGQGRDFPFSPLSDLMTHLTSPDSRFA